MRLGMKKRYDSVFNLAYLWLELIRIHVQISPLGINGFTVGILLQKWNKIGTS